MNKFRVVTFPDEKVEKLSSELEAMKEKNQRLQDQITFYQKFDFEHQLDTLIKLQKNLLDIEKRGHNFKLSFYIADTNKAGFANINWSFTCCNNSYIVKYTFNFDNSKLYNI